MNDVFTLAHEAGHAMHSLLADERLPFHEAGYPIFLAEIASTVNEVLLTWSLLEQLPAEDAAGRFAILDRFAEAFYGTGVRQTMFAEYEQRVHALVAEHDAASGATTLWIGSGIGLVRSTVVEEKG